MKEEIARSEHRYDGAADSGCQRIEDIPIMIGTGDCRVKNRREKLQQT